MATVSSTAVKFTDAEEPPAGNVRLAGGVITSGRDDVKVNSFEVVIVPGRYA